MIKILCFAFIVYSLTSCHKTQLDPVVPLNPNEGILSDTLIVNGYLDKFSYNQNERAKLFINSKVIAKSAKIGIYDVDSLLVGQVIADIAPQNMNGNLPYQNGFGYKVSSSFIIPSKLKSGLYFIDKKIPFLVKNNGTKQSEVLIVHPNQTDICYNNQGGMSLYLPSHQNRARVLSFDRPYLFGANGNPIPFYKWLKNKGYSYDFASDDDLQDYKNIQNYKVIVIAGHSEYWTRTARENFDKFVNSGKNALLLSGNTMYWQNRIDTVSRQLTCYKYDAYSNDPVSDIKLKTSRWEDAALQYDELKSIGVNFLTGGGYPASLYNKDTTGFNGYKILKPNFQIFSGLGLKHNDVIKHTAIEYDGGSVIFKVDPVLGNIPVYDNTVTNFYKVDILGWDYARPDNGLTNGHYQMPAGKYNIGLWLILKPRANSGLIINMSSSNWCNLMLENTELQRITANSIDFLLKNTDYTFEIQ